MHFDVRVYFNCYSCICLNFSLINVKDDILLLVMNYNIIFAENFIKYAKTKVKLGRLQVHLLFGFKPYRLSGSVKRRRLFFCCMKSMVKHCDFVIMKI